jgi:glucosyl-3-phosphoglycerate synthase
VTRIFQSSDFDASTLADAKGDTTISLCIPARNEAETIGSIIELARTELIETVPLLDEILVMDDHSEDRTAEVAAAAGATVASCAEVLTDYGTGPGKGQAMWKSVHESRGDVIVWNDADIQNFGLQFIVGILGPLLTNPDIVFSKGFYERPLDGKAGAGGRVTELVARPLFSLMKPELSQFIQPLSGEYGGRRSFLEQIPFTEGYGVETAMLLDLVDLVDLNDVAQVDLGTRVHRNRPLDSLAVQAQEVIATFLNRTCSGAVELQSVLRRPGRDDAEVSIEARPRLLDVADYLARHRPI